jgi:Tfp pilus assembly protein FimT
MHDLIATAVLGTAELLVIIAVIAVSCAIPIFAVIWFAKKTVENKQENVKLRLEVSKLAEELEQVRKQQQL